MTGPVPSGDRSADYEQIRQIFFPAPEHKPGGTRRCAAAVGSDFDAIEDEFGQFLDESLSPRGPGRSMSSWLRATRQKAELPSTSAAAMDGTPCA